MEIKFDSTLDELAEHHYRLFVRSATYRKNRWFGVAGSFLGVGTVFVLLENLARPGLPQWLPLLIAGVVAVAYLVFYPDLIRKNITSYLARKSGHEIPCLSSCRIKGGHVVCRTLNKEVVFEISDLVSVEENKELLELYFGPKGLWVIPKRAFESGAEIDRFKNMLRGEQGA